MQIIETTPPIERTFDIRELNTKQLTVLRKALSDFNIHLKDERALTEQRRQAEYHHHVDSNHPDPSQYAMPPLAPLEPSEEELLSEVLVSQIRAVERSGILTGPLAPVTGRPIQTP